MSKKDATQASHLNRITESMSKHFSYKFVIILIFFASQAILAEKSVWNFPIKAEDKSAIEEAFASMTKNEIIRGKFKQTKTIPQLKKSFVSTGTYTLAKNRGIIWNTQKPFPSQTAITDAKIKQQTATSQSEIRSDENAIFTQISQTIRAVFSGSTTILNKNFNVFFQQKNSSWEMGLTPKEDAVKKVIVKIELTGDTLPSTMQITDNNGTPMLYEFTESATAMDLTAEERALLE